MPTAPLAYVMRGQLNTIPYQDVTWKVYGTPDMTGAQSGYFGRLINIEVDYTIFDELTGTVAVPVEITMPMAGDVTGTSATSVVNMTGDVIGRTSANTVSKLQGRPMSATAPSLDQAIQWDGTQWRPATLTTQAAGGDLSGTYPNPTVIGLHVASGDLSNVAGVPYIKSISGNNGAGGTININSNDLEFAAGQTSINISQITPAATSGAPMTIKAQNSAVGSTDGGILTLTGGDGNVGGDLILKTGSPYVADDLHYEGDLLLKLGNRTFLTASRQAGPDVLTIDISAIPGELASTNNQFRLGAGGQLILKSGGFDMITLDNPTGDKDMYLAFNTLHIDGTGITATSASAGTHGDVPGQVAGYLNISINGTPYKIPFYNT